MSFPLVGVIILSWNAKEDTQECLQSLAKSDYPNYRAIVVDNGSSDGSPAMIKKNFPEVVLMEKEKNLGVAGGRNVGMECALRLGCDYLFFLDNDTVVDRNTLTLLVEALSGNIKIGAAQPKIYYYSEPERIWAIGGRWRPYTGQTPRITENDPGTEQLALFEVDYVVGSAFFIPRRVVEGVGYFDPAFNPYFNEDVDYSLRVKRKGFRTVCVASARMWHKISYCSGGGRYNPKYAHLKGKHTLLLMKKHANGLQWFTFILALLPAGIRALVREGLRGNAKAVFSAVRGVYSYFLEKEEI